MLYALRDRDSNSYTNTRVQQQRAVRHYPLPTGEATLVSWLSEGREGCAAFRVVVFEAPCIRSALSSTKAGSTVSGGTCDTTGCSVPARGSEASSCSEVGVLGESLLDSAGHITTTRKMRERRGGGGGGGGKNENDKQGENTTQ